MTSCSVACHQLLTLITTLIEILRPAGIRRWCPDRDRGCEGFPPTPRLVQGEVARASRTRVRASP